MARAIVTAERFGQWGAGDTPSIDTRLKIQQRLNFGNIVGGHHTQRECESEVVPFSYPFKETNFNFLLLRGL